MTDKPKVSDRVFERIEKSVPTAQLDSVIENNPEPGGSVPTGHFPSDTPAQPAPDDNKK